MSTTPPHNDDNLPGPADDAPADPDPTADPTADAPAPSADPAAPSADDDASGGGSGDDDGVDEVTRAVLRRRLGDIAATTTLDPEAWEGFEARLATQPDRRGHGPGVLLAVAAVVLVVLGVTMALLRGDDADRLDMAGNEATTTTEETTRRPGSTTTSTTAPGTTTTTAAAPEAGGGTDPGGGTSPDASQPEVGDPPLTPAQPEPLATRAEPVLTLPASGGEYTVELIWDGETMYFRRTDDVGTTVPGAPDGYGHVESSGWGAVGAPGCLASSGQEYGFPDAGIHAFTWGVMGSGIARVDVVMAEGARHAAGVGSELGGGARAWIVERSLGTVQRIEGRDANGEVVTTITELTGDWGSAGC